MKTCPDCQYKNPPEAIFCDNCGFKLQSTVKPEPEARVPVGTCSACGYQNTPGETFCQNCGVQLSPVPSTPPPPPTPYAGTDNQHYQEQKNAPITGDTTPITCRECGHINSSNETFCLNCGLQLKTLDQGQHAAQVQLQNTDGVESTLDAAMTPAPYRYAVEEPCPSCGFINVPGESFCQNCGLPLSPEIDTSKVNERYNNDEKPEFPDQSVYIPLICSSCGFHHTGKEAFCPNCGYQLISTSVQPETSPEVSTNFETKAFETISQAEEEKPEISGQFITEDNAREVPYPAGKSEIIIGRADPEQEIYPDMDLTAFGGEKGGVSRQHARLLRIGDHLLIEDLHSTNLTFLNTLRLNPGDQHLITDGDKIRLGGVVLVYKE